MSTARLAPSVAELHLHLEGSLRAESAVELAAARGLPWGELTPRQLRRKFRYASFLNFLYTVRDMAQVLCSYEGLERAARELSASLSANGVRYAEVYVSPVIYARWGLDAAEALLAADRGFAAGELDAGASCAILLDSVRHWGAAPAHAVLDAFEQSGCTRAIGFGLGGDETTPLAQFEEVFARVRSLGLRPIVHAGETGSAEDVRIAMRALGVERVAHGIRAVDDPGLLAEIRERGVALDVCLTSNYRTGAVRGEHPIRRLLDAGIAVTLSTDDPSLFRTDLAREFRLARRVFGVSGSELATIASNAIEYSFATAETKATLRAELARRLVG
ncbi:MAG: adenosine deaminase [Thermoanaerobaculia bacterium]|nr:adenosine deaminase [Thermoanaerobaculia bacterium]